MSIAVYFGAESAFAIVRRTCAYEGVPLRNLIYATIALSLLGSTAAVAQRDNPNYQSQNAGDYQNDGDRSNPYDQGSKRDPRQNNDSRSNPQGFNAPNSDPPHWSRGDRLPEQYRQNQYVVGDWQQHNLRTPPRGYRWVRNDNNQYLLATIGTGIIAEIVSQNQSRNDYQWSRGERLSGGYLENRYVVSDWRGNRLHRPARGQHWVRVNNQFMLTAIASGVIAEIVLNDR